MREEVHELELFDCKLTVAISSATVSVATNTEHHQTGIFLGLTPAQALWLCDSLRDAVTQLKRNQLDA